jgi:hypothetical protein
MAHAEASGRLVLEWTAPAECPTAIEVRSEVERRIGHEARVEGQDDLEVTAMAVEDPRGLWRGSVATRLGNQAGKRVLEAESCRAIAHATALIVALMIDPDAAQRLQVQGARGSNSSASTTASDAARPRKVEPRPAKTPLMRTATPAAEPRERAPKTVIRYRPGLVAALDMGTLPAAAPGVGASAAVLLGASALRAEAIRWAETRTVIAHTDPPVGGRFDLVSVSLAGCPGVAVGRFDVGLCAEAEFDWLKGTGTGVSSPDHKIFRWLSAGAGGFADMRLGKGLRMNAELDLLAPLGRSRFVLNGVSESAGEVHRTGLAVGRAAMGFGFVF